jgi:hypothetical protein
VGRQIIADWAWISKEPGAREDYGILAASAAQIHASDLAAVLVTGTPSSSLPADAPGAAPWVTFGSHLHAGGRPVLSISIHDHWEGRDQSGRPIWPRRFFACWYDDVATSRPSYRALWEAVADERLPRADRDPVPIVLLPDPADRAITAIAQIGLERVAAIAAALLDGPVAITETGDLRLSDGAAVVDRLGVLDAVAALLPYGFRAGLSAGSAVDNAVAHRIRLVLAGYASTGQQAAGLHDTPVTPRAGVAGDYLAMLLERERWEGLPAVIAHLRDATTACTFDRPEAALRILDRLNRSWHHIRKAKEGAEGLETSRAFFGGEQSEIKSMWRGPDLDSQTRARLLKPLLDSDDQQDAESLRQNWGVLAADVAGLASGLLDDGDVHSAVRSLAIAESLPDRQAADQLLCTLVSPSGCAGQAQSRAIAARARLLRQRPSVPAPATFDGTRASVRRDGVDGWHGTLFRELLSDELAADPVADRAVAWAAWLTAPVTKRPAQPEAEGLTAEPVPAGWVTTLEYTLADVGDGARESVRAVVHSDAAWAAIVFSLATRAGRVREVLEIPGLADDLIGVASAPATGPGQEAGRRALAKAVSVPLWDYGTDPAAIAAIDVVRMLLGGQPPSFPTDRPEQLARYDDGLTRVLGLPSARGARLEAVRSGLRQARAVIHLRAAVEQVIASPEALRRHADERFGVAASVLALAMYRAWRAGMSSARIGEVMAEVSVHGATLGQRVGYRELDNVLREFADLLAFPPDEVTEQPDTPDDRRAQARDVLVEFWQFVCRGALGASYGEEFRRHLDIQLRDEAKAAQKTRRRLRRPIRLPWLRIRQGSGPSQAGSG